MVITREWATRCRRRSLFARYRSPLGQRSRISSVSISSYPRRYIRSKSKREKAIHHFEVALGIASPYNWHHYLFWTHFSLALLFYDEGSFDDAHVHVDPAKSHAFYDIYHRDRAMWLQARVCYQQRRLGVAAPGALCAPEIFEKFGTVRAMGDCGDLLRSIEAGLPTPGESGSSGERTSFWKRYLRFSAPFSA